VEAEFVHADRLWRREVAALKPYHFPVGELRRDWWQAWAVPAYAHRFAILSRLAPDLLPGHLRLDWARHLDDCGWQQPLHATVAPEERRRRVLLALQGFAGILRDGSPGEPTSRALGDLLELCRRDGVPAALVWLPEASAFRAWYTADNLKQLQALLNRLSREYAVPLIDARTWVGDDDFADGHHLLPAGAAAFTERLGREVLLPLLAGRGA
jgi:hypothetical protein